MPKFEVHPTHLGAPRDHLSRCKTWIRERRSALQNGGSFPLPAGSALPGPEPKSAEDHRPVPQRERLSGNLARRTFTFDGFIWDTEITGFGLRHYASGYKSWVIQCRRRGAVRRISLGSVAKVPIHEARARARSLLAEAKLDGLPCRPRQRSADTPVFADFIDEFWQGYAGHWKPLTQRRSRYAIRGVLVPFFGSMALRAIDRPAVLAFRETRASRGGSFHTELAVLSAMLGYAEKLGYREQGSNPCRGVPRFRRPAQERYLSRREYQRLAATLRGSAREKPRSVAIVWLLLFTGARRTEIENLRWEWLTPTFVRLPDSKSGPKRLYLNRSANAVLDRVGRVERGPVFPSQGKTSTLSRDWSDLRRLAAIPDVRLHDLRHSFASVAITDNVPLLTLGRLLGHALPETTARYAHLADDDVQEAASRISGSIARAMEARS